MEVSSRHAGFWIRVAASLIDNILIQIAVTLAVIPLAIVFSIIGVEVNPDSPDWNIGGLAIFLVYETFMNASKYQGTFGKYIVNIKVTDKDGNPLSLTHALGRSLAKFVTFFTFLIGFFMAGWTKKKTALHDLLAGTYVVYR